MKVKYFHEQPGVSTGNIIWCERDRGSQYYRVSRFLQRNGKFTADHPAAPGSDRANEKAEFGDSEKMAEFRARGYWASCFPEGDGITLKCERGQSKERVMDDIRAVFGWEVISR